MAKQATAMAVVVLEFDGAKMAAENLRDAVVPCQSLVQVRRVRANQIENASIIPSA